MYACNGILFNHESPRRGETFVTRKITRGLANIAQGLEECMYMGNINALRDWGHAKDYVRMQWMMLQQDKPDDFVIATGVQYSVRQFIEWAAEDLGVKLTFEGVGLDEVAIVESIDGDDAPSLKVGDIVCRIDPNITGRQKLRRSWVTHLKLRMFLVGSRLSLCEKCVLKWLLSDLCAAKRNVLLKSHGHDIPVSVE